MGADKVSKCQSVSQNHAVPSQLCYSWVAKLRGRLIATFRGCHILSPCHFSCLCLIVTCFFFKYVPWNLFLAPSSVYVSCTPNKEFLKKCKVYYQTDRGKEKLIAEILWGDRSRQRTARTLIRLWDDPLFTDVATTTTKTTKNTPHWNCHLDFMRTLHPMKLLRPI